MNAALFHYHRESLRPLAACLSASFLIIAATAVRGDEVPAELVRFKPYKQSSRLDQRSTDLIARIQANDKNGDGEITRDEASEVLKRFFDRIDADSDGVIDQGELRESTARFRGGHPTANRTPRRTSGGQGPAQGPKAVEVSEKTSPVEVVKVKAEDSNTIGHDTLR